MAMAGLAQGTAHSAQLDQHAARMGAPGYSKPPGRIGSFEHGALLRFDRPTHSVHIQFRKDGGIELVTAMVASAVPGRNQGPQLDA